MPNMPNAPLERGPAMERHRYAPNMVQEKVIAERRTIAKAIQDAAMALPAEMRRPIATRHFFAAGVYAREITIPAGVCVIGMVHRMHHVCIISAGEVSVWDPMREVQRYSAPHTFLAEPGTKRVLYAHSETVFTTVHPNPDEERNIEILEARFVAPDFDALGLSVEQEKRDAPEIRESVQVARTPALGARR